MSVAANPNAGDHDFASKTDRGRVRAVNEDFCATFTALDCSGVVVADGVSSFHGGDTASRVAVEVLIGAFLAEPSSQSPGTRLYRAVQRANITVHDQALDNPELRSMATTLTALVLRGDELSAVHVGDCRLYSLRAGELRQLTRDHTVAAERTRLGILSKARARNHPDRSTLTRCLGRELMCRVDRLKTRVCAGDVLLVCSDGVHGLLDDREIAALSDSTTASLACDRLIGAANDRGAPDNVTAAVVRVSQGLGVGAREPGPFSALWHRIWR